ncbi:hypothetical protein [Leptobacterium sp. I13]|uniref:hypothetical protein n=1 Tax=Leptobacterium meishanense TaxID=3128904 RepID=UPI0030ED127E
MKNIISSLIGLAMIIYLISVIAKIARIVLGTTPDSWASISGHLVVASTLIILMIVGYFLDKKDSKKPIPEKKTQIPPKKVIQKPDYNPYEDKLHHAVYQQHVRSWWSDSDGDIHRHSTIHATLRFYEDGTIIGIRSSNIPKIEVPSSYTMKGNWTLDKNRLSFNLEKVSDIDDTVDIYISEEDRRQMKYAGSIANDDSLIKAGKHKGKIKGTFIYIKGYTFAKMETSRLIITASEGVCSTLASRLKKHPYVIDTFEDSGYWYSNGETGPEWFTATIETTYNHKDAVEKAVEDELKNMGKFANNFYWG